MMRFEVDAGSGRLVLEVWNQNMLGDDFIGSAELTLSAVKKNMSKKQIAIDTGT